MAWSPFRPDVMRDPANGYAELLEACPVHRCDDFEPPFYTLSRYADVAAALRDIETFSSQYGQGPRFTPPMGMLCDPPQHTFYRGLVQQAFTPRMIEGLRPRVAELAEELIGGLAAQGGGDLHDEFAFPLPVVIIAELLGVPTADLEQFKHWSDVQVAAMGARDPSVYAAEQAAFVNYMRNHLRSRRADAARGITPSNDLMTALATYRDNAAFLPEEQVLSVVNQLLVGGNETTTSLITNAVWRLLQEPGRWARVVADPDLVEAAVEESLRFDPPVLGLYRNTTRDVTVADRTIPAGSKVLLHYAAANRDPEVFPEPDRFDLDRPRRRHLAFGLGVHFCLGAAMARLEAEVALRSLATHLPNLALIDDGERIGPFFLWGRRRLPVRCP